LILGCLGALYQRKVKRLVAYSAISHAGYILIGIGSNSSYGVESVIFYLIIYVLMSISVFTIILNSRQNKTSGRLVYLTEFLGLSRTNIGLALTFGIILFSLAGVPPLAGFFSKMNLFLASINSSLYVTTAIALLLSGLGSVYYIRIVKIMFFDVIEVVQWYSIISKLSAHTLVIVISPLVLFVLYPDILYVAVSWMCVNF
jgi:NADH-quinone oxidoreductase subunit N